MEQNSLKAEEFYANPNPWMRQTSSEVPRTEAFTESLRGTPHIDPRASCLQDSEMSGTGGQRLIHNVTLATRPGSSGATSTSGLDVIGRDVKELMDGIQSLRHLGFETSVVPLPKIVVVGDQSTGKSSVIEGISGIKVPRNVGTCTRCPLEINLTNSQSPWQCRVFLSRRFAYAPQQFGRTVTKARPFGCWEPLNAPEEYAFAVLDSKEAVATTLLLAQLATLNPGMNYEIYQGGSDGNVPSGTMQCEFSPNVVRLDISGPGLPNLAFYDLPGMISHVAHDNQSSMPKLVENLVREYIKSENTIILLTLTMNHDLQNSKAAGFISKTKSDGKSRKADDRTVGVLTKPDLISPDSEESFVKIFLGEDFKRRLGYFVVKNNHNPAVSHSVARNEELRFFEEWPEKYPGLGRFKDRFGTLKLQEELSRLLADLIRESLPTIRETAKDKIREFEEHCSSLPKPPSGNLSLEIHNVIVTLCRQLEGMFNQLPGDANSEMARFQKTARDFRKRLVDSYPRLKPNVTNSEPLNQDVGSPLPSRQTAEFISIDDDDEDMTPVTPSRPPTNHASLARKRQLQHERQAAGEPKRARLDSAQPELTHQEAKIFTLEELHELITNRDDTGLTGPINPVVTKEIFLLSNDHWKQVVSNFVTQTLRLVGDAIIEQARRCFHAQVETALWKKIHSIIKSYIESLFQDVAAFAMRCLKMEKSVFTMDRTAVEPSRKRALEAMLADRRVERANRQIEEEERNGRNITDTVKSNRRLQARNGTGQSQVQDADVYQYELEQLATVHGYYQYAANRLCEYVVLCIRTEVFPKCTGDLCDAIKDALHLSDENANTHVRRLLEVSATVAEERTRCEEQLKLLNQGLQLLRELEEGAAFSEATTTQSTML